MLSIAYTVALAYTTSGVEVVTLTGHRHAGFLEWSDGADDVTGRLLQVRMLVANCLELVDRGCRQLG